MKREMERINNMNKQTAIRKATGTLAVMMLLGTSTGFAGGMPMVEIEEISSYVIEMEDVVEDGIEKDINTIEKEDTLDVIEEMGEVETVDNVLDATRKVIIGITGIETYKKDGITMVPLRQIMEEQLDLEVNWVQETRTVEIGKTPTMITVTIGEDTYSTKDSVNQPLPTETEIVNGVTYVAVDFFKLALGVDVEEFTEVIIKEVLEKDGISILIEGIQEGESSQMETILHITEETEIMNAIGDEVDKEELKAGTSIRVVMSEAMTMSLPPQGQAITIIVEDVLESVEQ